MIGKYNLWISLQFPVLLVNNFMLLIAYTNFQPTSDIFHNHVKRRPKPTFHMMARLGIVIGTPKNLYNVRIRNYKTNTKIEKTLQPKLIHYTYH